METDINNRFGPNRQFQHFQCNNYPARAQKPKFVIIGDTMTKKTKRKDVNNEARNYYL